MIGGYNNNCIILRPFFNDIHILFAPKGRMTLALVSKAEGCLFNEREVIGQVSQRSS
jgi:hypothetical protein